MEMKKCAALGLIVLAGCAETMPETVFAKNKGTVHVRPIFIADTDGDTPWTPDRLETMIRHARAIFAMADLQIDMKPIERLNCSDLCDVNDGNVEELCLMAKESAEVYGELAVFFVKSFVRKGVPYSGLAFMPGNNEDDHWRHGVFVAQLCYENTLAHELGHAFGLRHAWRDDSIDTQIIEPEDCDAPQSYCNVMHICGRSTAPECLGQELTDGQIEQIRSWTTQSPRDQVISWNDD